MKINKKYFIKEPYIHRTEWYHCDQRISNVTDGYQHIPYLTAQKLCVDNNFKNVLDIGTGNGWKLVEYFPEFDTTGLEIEPTLNWLKNKYPNHKWAESNFKNKLSEENFDVVLCCDVIEHLMDPDELIEFIESLNFKYLVISTPERKAIQLYQRGYCWDGPPDNKAHIREWAFEEFSQYMSDTFEIKEQFMCKNKSETAPLCQVVVATKKGFEK